MLTYEVIAGLEEKFGDAFYVVDLQAFQRNFEELLAAFRADYQNTRIAYSYKTNYLPRLCRLVDEWGGYAEVVSALEYQLARKLGVAPEAIIFNGPYKTPDDMASALTAGSVVNLDWPYQVQAVEALAEGWQGAPFRVGLRVTFGIAGVAHSRFGFDADGSELESVLARLRRLPAVRLEGLHCHFLTPTRSAEDYRQIARRMIELARAHFPGDGPQFLDVGGGFFSTMPATLADQFPAPIPGFRDYGSAVAGAFASAFGRTGTPELIIEPGLALTADVVEFVTRVVDVRTLRGKPLVLVSGSFYDIKPTGSSRNLPVRVVRGTAADRTIIEGKLDIVGNTCMEHDVLHRGFAGSIGVGDYLVFGNVGSYTNVLKPPFIRGCRPMVAIDPSSGQVEMLRAADEVDQVFASYTW